MSRQALVPGLWSVYINDNRTLLQAMATGDYLNLDGGPATSYILAVDVGAVVVNGPNIELTTTLPAMSRQALVPGVWSAYVNDNRARKQAATTSGYLNSTGSGANEYRLSVAVGAITVNGIPIELTRTGGGYILSTIVGAVVVAGSATGLMARRNFDTASGSVVIAGLPIELTARVAYTLDPGVGAVVIAGPAVELVYVQIPPTGVPAYPPVRVLPALDNPPQDRDSLDLPNPPGTE